MPFQIVRNDITKMPVDAIVNAANTALQIGGGVCGAIFESAGKEKMQAACEKIGGCGVGEAVVTEGFALPAKYVIHTAGPVWQGGGCGEAELLRNCYIQSLHLAKQAGCESVAFPLISSGIYGYPKEQALQIAVAAIGDFLRDNDMTVYLAIFDKQAVVLSEKLFHEIGQYIDDHYVEEKLKSDRYRRMETGQGKSIAFEEFPVFSDRQEMQQAYPALLQKGTLEDALSKLDESFSQMLLRLIDEKQLTDVETYKRANVDRKLFSKIRSIKGYNPSKTTAIAFAIALRLNLDETIDLLNKAGYTLSHSSRFDVIIEYFIENGNHDIHEINRALFAFDQTLLGA